MDTRDPHAPADRELLQRAADEWRDALIDVGGTNRLLHFRSTAATVDLAQAAPDAYTALLAGGAVRLSQLFPGADAHAAAHRASLELPEVQAAIAAARPMLSGEFGGFRFTSAGSPLRP